jgi:hypothetical protein
LNDRRPPVAVEHLRQRTGGTTPYHSVKGGGFELPEFFLHPALRDPLAPVHRLGLRVAAARRR